MKAGIDPRGHQTTLSSMFEAVGAFKEGKMSQADFEFMEKMPVPPVVPVPACSQPIL